NIPIKDVLSLSVGDVVRLYNVRVGDTFSLNIGNKKKYLCRPGIVGKKVAVQIVKKTEELEKEEFEELTAEGEDGI
ncbi:MAG: FliM/FliN family flagellar motor switch protein, partial [Treponema sp.]|nr:FliM/FliN family flagellar motor switch protein [Treponema sp.]